MKIDKSLFLLLTGTLAGTACYINTVPNNPPATPGAPSVAPPPTTPPTTPPPAAGGPHLSGKGLGLKGTPIDLGDGGAPTPPPAATDAGAPSACLDNGAATAVDCNAMTDKSCGWASKRCAAYNQYLKPKVAAQAASCTTQAKDACSAQSALTCGVTAMKSACTDPQVATICTQLAATCKDTVDNCNAILSSLNAAGQQAAATYCAAEGGARCAKGVGDCVDKALFPAAEGGTGGGRPKY